MIDIFSLLKLEVFPLDLLYYCHGIIVYMGSQFDLIKLMDEGLILG